MNKNELDRHITGNYGEDFFTEEHTVRRLAKEFVKRYLEDPASAGKFAMSAMTKHNEPTEEEIEFWKEAIAEEFARQGYELQDDPDDYPGAA